MRFDYQPAGAAYLAAHHRAILADEQGLGKTVQAIDAADQIGARSILVVCKAIAKIKWQREFERFSQVQRVYTIMDSRTRIPAKRDRVVIVNYELLTRPAVLQQLIDRKWSVLIVDEMQAVKAGMDSKRGQIILDPQRGLWRRAKYVWGLSGTPAPNHLGDLYAWLSTLHPELLDGLDYEDFLRRHCEVRSTPYGLKPIRLKDKAAARKLTQTIMLRRKWREVFPDGAGLLIDELPLPAYASENLPSMLETPDAERLRVVLEALDPDENPQSAIAAAELDLSAWRRLTGILKSVPVTAQVVEELEAGEPKIVVMGWHRKFLDDVTERLSAWGAVCVHGATLPRAKQDAIDRFENDPACRVFVGQLLTAGTSIDLTAASRMILGEINFVPGDVDQAIRRILRVGQRETCRVSFASLANSVDEIVMRVYASKARQLAGLFSDS